MTEETQITAFQTYAKYGELSILKKQLSQQIQLIDNQLQTLEQKIVELSTPIKQIESKETSNE